jgi:hypothetical protein
MTHGRAIALPLSDRQLVVLADNSLATVEPLASTAGPTVRRAFRVSGHELTKDSRLCGRLDRPCPGFEYLSRRRACSAALRQ